MTEDRMKKFIISGGGLFVVTSIETIRDGGTKVINTTKGDLYVDKNSKRIHYEYPPSNKNLVVDSLLVEYTTKRVGDYIEILEGNIEDYKNLLKDIEKGSLNIS